MCAALQVLTFSVICFCRPSTASAHRDDYIDETFVYSTLAKSEFELEAWFEHRVTALHVTENWYTTAFEYGITSRWTLDGAGQFADEGSGLKLGRLRVETRYRFAEEGAWPLDIATSVEFERETVAGGSSGSIQTLTPRLVVSKDIVPALNTTVNLDVPIQLNQGTSASLAYAVALRYPAEGFLRLGSELKGQPEESTLTLFPQVWFALPHEATAKVGVGIGLTDASDRSILRFVIEEEL